MNGVGLVKLMGRDSGFIACYAALAGSNVDFVLIPEVPFELEGEGGLLECLRLRVKDLDLQAMTITIRDGKGGKDRVTMLPAKLVPALRDALAATGRPDIMIVVGGVIPPGDFDELYAAGATAIYPPGTVIAEAAVSLMHKLAERLGYELG